MSDTTYDNISTIADMDVDGESGFTSSMLTFAALLTFLIMIVGICGNFLTIAALVKCPKVRNVAAAFIISLCLADLLFCALVLPFSALRFLRGTWTHGDVLCKLIPFIQYGNIGVSLLCIAMITINRYVMITHHSSYARIYKRHWIAVMIAFCWLFSYGMQLPTLLGVWGKFGYDAKLGTCSIMSDEHGHSSKTSLFITAFVIPCLIIVACYAKIFWVVHKSEQRLKKHANKQNSIPNNLRPTANSTNSATNGGEQRLSSNVASETSSFSTDVNLETLQKPSRIKDQREVRAKRNEWRITKMVLAIFLSFVICYLPITIVKVADKDVEYPGWHIFSYIMLYLSACINPIIYVIMNKQYRKAYKTVIMCEPSKLLLPFAKSNGASSAAEKWKDTGLSNNHSRTMVSQMSAGGAAGTSAEQQHQQNKQQQQQSAYNGSNSSRPQSMIALEMMTKSIPKTASSNAEAISTTKSTLLPKPPMKSITQPSLPLSSSLMSPTLMTATITLPSNNLLAKELPTKKSMISGGVGAVGTTSISPTATYTNSMKLNGTNPNNNQSNHNSQNSNSRSRSSSEQPTTITTVNRIALVGGDIILEEEERTSSDQETATVATTTISPTTTTTATIAATTTIAPLTGTTTTTPSSEMTKYYSDATPKKAQFYGQNINGTPDSNPKVLTKLKL